MVLATEDDLYQIAFNLMENAVKYNVRAGQGHHLSLPPGGPGAPDGGGHRGGHPGGGPAQDLRPLLPGGQGPLPGRRRHRLGLSIVRDTARQHGGAVSVRRREPVGTCFQVAFPRWYDREVEL